MQRDQKSKMKYILENFRPKSWQTLEDFLQKRESITRDIGEKIHFFSVNSESESETRKIIDSKYTLCMRNFRDKEFVIY